MLLLDHPGCVCVASRGLKGEDYAYYKDGISRIRSHIKGSRFSGEIAGAYAAKVLYLTSVLMTGKNLSSLSDLEDRISGRESILKRPRQYSYLRIVDRDAYECLLKGAVLLQEYGGDIV